MRPVFGIILSVLIVSAWAQSSPTLEIRVWYPDANLDRNDVMTLRGDHFGLSWNSGVKMTHSAPSMRKCRDTDFVIDLECY